MAIRKVTIEEISKGALYSDLIVPSHSHAYNVCVEYIKNWLLERCPKNFFKDESIYVDGSYIFSDMAKMTKAQMLKRPSPNLTIIPELDYQFNNEFIDLNSTKLKTYVKRFGHDKAFFVDFDKDIRIGINFETIKMNTQYRIKVKTKNQQLDLYHRLKLALGQTSGQYISTDIHVPYELMLQVAQHAGFKITADNRIEDSYGFIVYLNSHSAVPFMYKLRYVNSKEEFFIRANDVYIHTRVTDISVDNGERVGQLMNNFTIEINTETRFPAPQVYILYSLQENLMINKGAEVGSDEIVKFINTIRLQHIPDTNDKGWNSYVRVDVVEENLTETIKINFSPLFEGTDIQKVIDYTRSIRISPATFLDIKMFNKGKELPLKINWETFDVEAEELHTDSVSLAVVYIDNNYVNSTLTVINEMMKSRLN